MSAAKERPQGGGNRAGAQGTDSKPSQCTDRSTAAEAQRQRIVKALQRRPQTTEDLRKLGIFQVPARVKELRDRHGYQIETARVTVVDREGYSHARAALYSLRGRQEGVA